MGQLYKISLPNIILTCCFKTGENDRFQHKKCKKIQIFTSSKMDKKSI